MSDIVLAEIGAQLQASKQYTKMIEKIENSMTKVTLDSENFHKSSSQFKGVTLDVTNLTPINSAKHILAVLNRTRQALEEAHINLKRKRAKLEHKTKLLETATGYEAIKLEIDIEEIQLQISNIEAASRGAIRKMSFFTTQYEEILKKIGVDHLTEEDYEKDETRYHVMTAFFQALTAARARGGLIDEGNQIYMFQLGINGAVAQAEVTAILAVEQEMLNNGKEPTHEMLMAWLEACADKFAPYSIRFAESRGLVPLDESSLISIDRIENKMLGGANE